MLQRSSFFFANAIQKSFAGVRAQMPAEMVPSFDDWMKASVEQMVRSVQEFTEGDVLPVIEIASAISPECFFEA